MREPFDVDALDDTEPFEVDRQAAHLFKHPSLGLDDVLDVWSSDPLFYPARPPAHWLMLAEVGGRGATFARIAERAGISPSLISYHFSSRAVLMERVVAQVVEDMDRTITAALEGEESPRAALRTLIEAQVAYFAGHLREVLALGRLADSGDDEIGGRLSEHRRASLQEIEELFVAGQDAGELAAFAPRPMAVTLLAALEAAATEMFENRETDATEYGRELADLFDAATRRQRGRRGRR